MSYTRPVSGTLSTWQPQTILHLSSQHTCLHLRHIANCHIRRDRGDGGGGGGKRERGREREGLRERGVAERERTTVRVERERGRER